MELLLAAPFLCLHVLFVFRVPEGAEKVESTVFTGLGAFVSAALLNAHELVANLNLIIDNFSEECFSRYDTVEAFGVFHYFYNEKNASHLWHTILQRKNYRCIYAALFL